MSKLKKTLIILFVTMGLASCDVLNQVAQMANFANCTFNFNNVNQIQMLGVNLSKGMTKQDLNVSQLLSLTNALMNRSLPVSFNVNVDVKNPNSIAAAMAKGISTDDYVLVEGGVHMVTSTGGVAYDDEDAEYTGTSCVKADNYFAMTGGSLTLKNTGDGGKGIRAGSYDFDETNHTLSDSYVTGGSLSISTTGREVNDVSAKGVKIGWVTKEGTGDRAKVTGNAGKLVISGGTITVNSTYGEGLEVKGDLTFEGGETYVSSVSEDAINCQGDLTVNQGFVYAFSSGNDAMDSNGNTNLNGGYVMAICTKGSPEVAIDANTEEGKKLYVNSGATLVAYGGLENGYQASQSVFSMSGTAGSWNALSDGKSFIAAFKAPSNVSSFIVSAPSLSSGYKGVSVSGNGQCNGVWATTGISGGTSVSLTNYTGGNGGPGGGGQGGGRPGGR